MLILRTSAFVMRMDKLREENPSVFKKLCFSIDLASSALLRKAKALNVTKFGCTRQNINKFTFCSHLHEFSSSQSSCQRVQCELACNCKRAQPSFA